MAADQCRCGDQPDAAGPAGPAPCRRCRPARSPLRRTLADARRAVAGALRRTARDGDGAGPRDGDLLVQELTRLAGDPSVGTDWRSRLTTLLLQHERGELGSAAPAAAGPVIPLPAPRTGPAEQVRLDLRADAAGNR
ncbi:hypothetical protein CLV92_10333 [Kineococcus xinjiangensis]|uniref:Uncharacterized protein n=1 Tax=Kineococcus xinjiangensis TaxID=512762 RepID=A0A2S6ITC9_9ACTN|nr:hypothetical protein [Kineococcus xinjiangensis]PPK97503.1 hypothetical protein CLV92_10333 [Kineococcus xinjiangensis]